MSAEPPSITVGRALYEDRDEDIAIRVETDDPQLAAAALEAAVPRLELVTYDGREYETEEALRAADLATGGGFDTTNPSFIFDVTTEAHGASVRLDTDGAAPAAMGRTVVRVVAEELMRVGVTRARIRPA